MRLPQRGTDLLLSVTALVVAAHQAHAPANPHSIQRHLRMPASQLQLPDPPDRYLPEEAFPPYSYVPGRWPHPVSDPQGHLHGVRLPQPVPLTAAAWRENRVYLLGIDQFNHGYYWEAHETWEALWQAAERQGPIAACLKGLIKLAAAGVKTREQRPIGVRRHALRAAELFQQAELQQAEQRRAPGEPIGVYLGLDLPELILSATSMASSAELLLEEPLRQQVVRTLPVALTLQPG